MSDARRDLSAFTGREYDIGRPKVVQALWLFVSGAVLMRWWCPAMLRVRILRAFGARIGANVLIRHRVRIHWPWKLEIGDNSWVGEGAWLLNLEPITIGKNVCISQDVLLCTGSHDRHSPTFEFDNGSVVICDQAWVAARAVVLRGVTIGEDCVISANVTVSRDTEPGTIFK